MTDESNGTTIADIATEKKKRRNQYSDPEQVALRKVGESIQELDSAARERVLGYWWSRNQHERAEAARAELEATKSAGARFGQFGIAPRVD